MRDYLPNYEGKKLPEKKFFYAVSAILSLTPVKIVGTLMNDWLVGHIKNQQRQRRDHRLEGPFKHAVVLPRQTLQELQESCFQSRK